MEHGMLRPTLFFLMSAMAMAQTETFLVKDKLTTLRLVTLTGDKVEEQVYDAHGFATLRTINLDISSLKEDLPTAGPPRDGTRTEDLPLGRMATTYRSGMAIARRVLSRKRPSAGEVAGVLEALVGQPAVSVDPFAPPGGYSGHGLAYAFYGRLGLFIPWRLDEQALFGSPVSAGRALPGDLLIIAAGSRASPDRVAIALGGGMAVLADPRKASVVKMAIADLPGCVQSARRVLGSVWEGYLAQAPSDLLALVERRGSEKRPDWNRIQGLASFYDHYGSEAMRSDVYGSSALAFVPGGAPNQLRVPDAQHQFTVAHRSLPLGTKVRVTVLENKRSIVCTVADRGNFENERSFEVCFEAAQVLGLDQLGVAVVEVEWLDPKATRISESPSSGPVAPSAANTASTL
jgi:hypothetical protein